MVDGKAETRLDYISLCSQVTEGKRKGYKDDEIAFALRRAVTTGTELRRYLDSLPSLTLQEILQCIRSAYQEKSATELFQELTSLCQQSSENSQAFLFRALGLRQRVFLASEAEDQIHYDNNLVQSIFLHAISTGLSSDNIRSIMQPLLDVSRVASDNQLIEKMTKATSEENERLSKQKMNQSQRSSTASVNEVSSGMEQAMKPLLKTIKDMTEKLDSLQSEMSQLKNNARPSSWKRRGCEACTASGASYSHCWKCGKSGHISRRCQVRTGESQSCNRSDGSCTMSTTSSN